MPATLRWSLYLALIIIAAGMMLARVVRVRSADPKNPTPFLSANDRSRWATIRALGDDGTYAIEHIVFDQRGNPVRGWHTIDMVRHRGPDEREHYYSSKPTLLTTLLAGEYWLIKAISGATLGKHTLYVARLMLILTNVLPLAVALVFIARLVDVCATSDYGRIFAVAAACFGTFLTTFAVTLNNHVPAAISLVAAVVISLPVWRDDRREWWRLAAAGFCFAFLAANELPALSLLVLAGLGLAWKAPLQTATGFLPAVLLVAAAALGTNTLAHGDWRTPYAHRGDGPVVARLPDSMAEPLINGIVPVTLVESLRQQGIEISGRPTIEQRVRGERWMMWDEATHTRLLLVRTPEGTKSEIEVRDWDNWYDYEGSYWKPDKLAGVDRGEPSRLIYAFHCLIGHHGLFSLTPIWLLAAIGTGIWLITGTPTQRLLAFTTLVITAVVIAFYLSRPQIDRNFGGVTSCLRWLIWLTPLWLLTLLPAADRLARSWTGRGVALALLGVSVFSAHYAADNPWSHPWLFDYWTSLGWIKY
jgi:hypothetical protein